MKSIIIAVTLICSMVLLGATSLSNIVDPEPEKILSVEATEALGKIEKYDLRQKFINSTVYDIDGDGVDETLEMFFGTTSGVFSCYIIAETDGNVKYVGYFITNSGSLALSEDEPGKLLMYGYNYDNIYYVGDYIEGIEKYVADVFDIKTEGDLLIIEKDGEEVGQNTLVDELIVNVLKQKRDNPELQ